MGEEDIFSYFAHKLGIALYSSLVTCNITCGCVVM